MHYLAALFVAASQLYSLPPGLLSAVCHVESNYKIDAINYNDGGSDSVGVCMVKLETARDLGFKGTAKQLARPRTNIHFAAVYLHKQLMRYDGDIYKAVAAYNSGTHLVNRRGLTVNREYVEKVLTAWRDDD